MTSEMVLVKVDRGSAVPMFQQIVQEVRRLIESESLPAGDHLPPTRDMAAILGINRSTVFRAYQELIALGYVDSRPGSFTTVRDRPKTTAGGLSPQHGLIAWESISNPASRSLYETSRTSSLRLGPSTQRQVIDLSRLEPDSRLFPLAELRRCTNDVIKDGGRGALQYGEVAGSSSLREYIARRLQVHGISVASNEILITNGSHHALELILRLLTRPGSTVVIESPTYANFIPLLRFHDTQIIEIPLKKDGMDVDRLNQEFMNAKPAFVYTMPNFHNPTGITSSQRNREALLSLCEQRRVPIIEDGFEEEMKYGGNVSLPIKSMDKHHIVIYTGTFSKVLFPGMRIGWIAAEKECIDRLTAIRKYCELSGNAFAQAVVTTFCRKGYYDHHLRKMHRVFRRRMRVALDCMEQFLPASATWTRPEGGYTTWVTLKRSYASEKSFAETLLRHGVAVAQGHHFFSNSQPKRHFRLSISTLDEEEIQEGIRRLGKALHSMNRS